MTEKVLEELRNFEQSEEARLKKTIEDYDKKIETEKRDILKKVRLEKEKLLKKKADEVKKAEDKANEDSKVSVSDYKNKIARLQKSASKNFESAVDKIFAEIIM